MEVLIKARSASGRGGVERSGVETRRGAPATKGSATTVALHVPRIRNHLSHRKIRRGRWPPGSFDLSNSQLDLFTESIILVRKWCHQLV